jgi:hypothetical protein
MTMKIEVTIPEDDVRAGKSAAYLASAMSAIGFGRSLRDSYAATQLSNAAAEQLLETEWDALRTPEPDLNEVLPDEGPNYAAM